METIDHMSGTQADITFTLRDADGVLYDRATLADIPTAVIWPGDQQGVLATPAARWVDNNPAAGVVGVTVTAADIEALPPAVYQLMVSLKRGTVVKPAAHIYYRVVPGPGGGTPLKFYGDYQDLLISMPTLDDIQAGTSQAGLAEERAEASRWLEGVILAKARDAGEREQMAKWLASGRLIVDRNVRRMVADFALGLALQGRFSGKGPDDPYPSLGRNFMRSAKATAKSVTVYIDGSSSGDGSLPLGYNLAVINTRRG